jgi:hypothetical protein
MTVWNTPSTHGAMTRGLPPRLFSAGRFCGEFNSSLPWWSASNSVRIE